MRGGGQHRSPHGPAKLGFQSIQDRERVGRMQKHRSWSKERRRKCSKCGRWLSCSCKRHNKLVCLLGSVARKSGDFRASVPSTIVPPTTTTGELISKRRSRVNCRIFYRFRLGISLKSKSARSNAETNGVSQLGPLLRRPIGPVTSNTLLIITVLVRLPGKKERKERV